MSDRPTAAPNQFLARTAERQSFDRILRDLQARRPDSTQAAVVLLCGHGGLGKTTLLNYLQESARGVGVRVISFDFERDAELHPADYADGNGPPVWKLLNRLYLRLSQAQPGSKRWHRRVARAFDGFRVHMARSEALITRAERLGLAATLGRRRLTVEDIRSLLTKDLVGDSTKIFGAAPVQLTGQITKTALSVASLIESRRALRVDEEDYQDLPGELDALVNSFLSGLERISTRRQPCIFFLDTAELLGDAAAWLREAAAQGGPRIAWTLALRMQAEGTSGPDSEVVRWRRRIDEARLHVFFLSRFDDVNLRQYASMHLSKEAYGQLDFEQFQRVTRGIPLAASLACNIMTGEADTNSVLIELGEDGSPSQLIRNLTQRYLNHAENIPAWQTDLPNLYALALVGPGTINTPVLSALLDVPEDKLEIALTSLERRYDFLLRTPSGIMHEDVRYALLLSLLDPVRRPTVRSANIRAAEELNRQISALDLPPEELLTSERWQQLFVSKAWHTTWVDPQLALQMLCSDMASILLLAPLVGYAAVNAVMVMGRLLSDRDRRWLKAVQDFVGQGGLGRYRPTEFDNQGTALLVTQCTLDSNVSDTAVIPREIYINILRSTTAQATITSAETRLSLLRSADYKLQQVTAKLRRRTTGVLSTAYLYFASQIINNEASADSELELAGEAADRSYALAGTAQAKRFKAAALGRLFRFAEAVKTLEDLAVQDQNPSTTGMLGHARMNLGKFEEALRSFDEVIQAEPGQTSSYVNAGLAARLDGQDEASNAYLHQGLTVDPNNPSIHVNLGEAYLHAHNFELAEYHLRMAIRLRPDDTLAAGTLLGTIVRITDFDKAAQLFTEARNSFGVHQTEFERCEFRAIASIDRPDFEEYFAKLITVAGRRDATDVFDAGLYDLLRRRPTPQLDQLIEFWKNQLTSRPAARCRCSGCSRFPTAL